MPRILSVLLVGILITAVLPTTAVYIIGLAISIAGTLGTNTQGFNPAFLYFTMLLLIPGYSLCCLWWLIFKFQNISLNRLPKKIWAGLIIGILISVLFLFPSIKSASESLITYITDRDQLRNDYIFGGGPLLITLATLLFVYLKNSRK